MKRRGTTVEEIDAVAARWVGRRDAGLTARELDCLPLVSKGFSDREIAAALHISVSTAHEHVENARKRFEAANRAELVAAAVSLGVIHF